uniref:Uncharacterized protein n=1 Tax=Triticum urartu TaxID=4572 RepID=A0A8R7R1N6_TRIUA
MVVATKTNGRIIRPTLSNWLLQILFGKPADSQSRKAWSLSCNDNNNLGVSCKNNSSSFQPSVRLQSVNDCSSTMTHSDSCIQS